MIDKKLFVDKKGFYNYYGEAYCDTCNNEVVTQGIFLINRKGLNIFCNKDCVKKHPKDRIYLYNVFILTDKLRPDFTLVMPRVPDLKAGDVESVWDVDSIDKKYGSSDKDVDKTRLAGRSQELISMKEEPKQELIGEYKGEKLKVSKDVKERIEELDKPVDDIDSLISKFKNEKEVEEE